jgi:hypothetical protein
MNLYQVWGGGVSLYNPNMDKEVSWWNPKIYEQQNSRKQKLSLPDF